MHGKVTITKGLQEHLVKADLNNNALAIKQTGLHDIIAQRCEITLREQYVSRRDMFQLCQMMNNRTVFKNNYIEFKEIKFRIRSIFTSQAIDYNDKATN